ncbi:ribosome maturation factor RimM [Luteococcus sp. OSA5]|uniref:ribosome maturation factor RimM n=1 Tax=Luteococcus sp. OSA5 TaxID=3401630 RepID=UPI003B42F1E2
MTAPVEVVVGTIGRAHGIKGDVAIELRTDEPERRFAPGAVLRVEGTRKQLTVETARWHSGRMLVHFAELADRTAVEQARGQVLVVDVDPLELPEEDDEYYDRQLVGLTALRADGSEAGPVVEVVHLPVQDLLAIRTAQGDRLVPFVTELVPAVDLTAGTVQLADVPGLLDEDQAVVADGGQPA